jgi:hypothetical protein
VLLSETISEPQRAVREERMSEEEQRAVDAIRLLGALVDQARVEGGHVDVAGVTVVPSTVTAEEAGMVFSTPRYNAAMEALLEVGALRRDEAVNALFADAGGEPEHGSAIEITPEGLDLLGRTGA